MARIGCARRDVLRLLACCGAARGGSAPAALRWPAWLLPQRKPVPPLPSAVVVIDPGHGGIDPGAIGASGVYEKTIVLATAMDLARLLSGTHRFRVFLTRHQDEYVPLPERVARARAWHADVFIAIHADALPNSALRGLSVFTLSAQASDRDAETLAQSENREVVDGVNLERQTHEVGNVLLDLARRQNDNLSLALARDVVTALGQEVALRDNPQRSANFVVLTAPDIPSVLVELGCLSNRVEERLLQQRAYQEKLARGLAQAVETYFAAHRSS
jgi:N-acetylmuramoyl-L-alanine amidase